MGKEKKFEILNYDELPIKSTKNRNIICWADIKKGFIFKTQHIQYGYNEFEFVSSGQGDCLLVKYKDTEYKTVTYLFTKGHIGRIIGEVTNEYKYNIGDMVNDLKRNMYITEREIRPTKQKADKKDRIYVKYEKWYKYTCNVCGWTEGWIPENNLIKGTGCSCCANQTAVLWINTIWDTERWMCDLGVSEEDAKKNVSKSKNKIRIICPDCKRERSKASSDIYKNKSISCICGDGFSYPEKFMTSMLTQLGAEFESQYNPYYLCETREDRIVNRYSDFYLPGYNLIIETDGGIGHKGGTIHSKSNKTLEECIEIDNWKDEQHRLHGTETIRINCFKSDIEFIKENILNSKLSEIFDLSKVNWLKCEEFAIKSNRVKEICKYWNNRNQIETTFDLEKVFKCSKTAILLSLKKGVKLGWCEYNVKEERRRASLKIGKTKIYPVCVFYDGIMLGVFKSATELERQSEELFGTRLNHSSIYATIYGKQKSHKGYTFLKLSKEKYEEYLNSQSLKEVV